MPKRSFLSYNTSETDPDGHRPGCLRCVTCSRRGARRALDEYNALHAAGILDLFLTNHRSAPAIVPAEEWVAPRVRASMVSSRAQARRQRARLTHSPPTPVQAVNDLWDERARRRLENSRWERAALLQLDVPTTKSLTGKCAFVGVVLVTDRGDRLECEDASDLAAGLGVDSKEAERVWTAYRDGTEQPGKA